MSKTRQLAAIMFTDLVGYTSLMGADEERAFDLLQKNRELQRPLLEKHNGRFIKEIGDGILASFSSASDAVYCALEIQKDSQKHSDLSLRIGVHLGDVVFQKDDVFGDGVNIASRIQELAFPNGVLVSESVHQNVSNKKGIATEFIVVKLLRGVKEPVRVYQVKLQSSERPTPSDHRKQVKNPAIEAISKKSIWWFVTALLLAAIGYLIFNKSKGGEPETDSVVLENSIAVLPFVDMSAEKDQEYLGDGIAEEIINTLAKAEDLKVIARTSSFQFKGENIDIRDVGLRLNVNYVVEGSVRKYEDQLRITVQLIYAGDGSHIWSKDFDRQYDEIFTVQSQIAQSIYNEISSSLQLAPLKSSTGTTNTDAYEYYMKGVYMHNQIWHFNEPSSGDYEKVEQLFQEAIELDSNFADAYAGLADLYDTKFEFNSNDSAYKHKAKINADISFKLNPESCYANIVKGQSYHHRSKPKEGINHFLKAIELCPGNSQAYHGLAAVLNDLGLHRESLTTMEKALEVDPLNGPIWAAYGWLKGHVGQFEDAQVASNEVLDLEDQIWPLFVLACYIGDIETVDEYIADSSSYNMQLAYSRPWLLATKGDTSAIQAAENINMPITPSIRLLLTRANKNWTHASDDWAETNYFNTIKQAQNIPFSCCSSEITFINDTEIEADKEFTDLIQPLMNNPQYTVLLDEFKECQARNRQMLKEELNILENLLID